jgi:hypothetical protein
VSLNFGCVRFVPEPMAYSRTCVVESPHVVFNLGALLSFLFKNVTQLTLRLLWLRMCLSLLLLGPIGDFLGMIVYVNI